MTSIIMISGPDGSGKTTIAKFIAELLRKRGYPVVYAWLRYPRFFSVFPLIVSRWIGTTIKLKRNKDCIYTYHYYKSLPILGNLYELLILIDYIIYKVIKVWICSKLGFIIIVDRNLLDIAVDIYIERASVPKLILHYLSYETKNSKKKLVILSSIRNLIIRRKDNMCNPNIATIVKLYKYLGSIFGYKIQHNDTLADLVKILYSLISGFQPIRVYADPKCQLLRALYKKYRWLIYVTNFFFQSTGYMWWVELVFRLAIQSLIIFILFIAGIHPLFALFISHAILYPIYANIFDIEKWFGKRRSINNKKVLLGLEKLEDIGRRYKTCIDIVIVGSIARNPGSIFKKNTDIDARIVPNKNFKCILTSLFLAMYLRLWSILNKVPLDLYVKSRENPEIQDKSVFLDDVLAILRNEKIIR